MNGGKQMSNNRDINFIASDTQLLSITVDASDKLKHSHGNRPRGKRKRRIIVYNKHRRKGRKRTINISVVKEDSIRCIVTVSFHTMCFE